MAFLQWHVLRYWKQGRGFAVGIILALTCPYANAKDWQTNHSLAKFPSTFQQGEDRPGGAATAKTPSQTKKQNRFALTQPSPLLPWQDQMDFYLGQALFEKIWVSAPASTPSSDGVGPLFNARACKNCHMRNGRGHSFLTNAPRAQQSTVIKLSTPPPNATLKTAQKNGALLTLPDPVYGEQLQNFAIHAHQQEASIAINYTKILRDYADGQQQILHQPRLEIRDLAYGPLQKNTEISVRIAPAMLGLGLLEAIPAADLIQNEDPADADNDGVSGRAHRRLTANNSFELGRFGWKAAQVDLHRQSAHAFAIDMGLSTRYFPDAAGDCTSYQGKCRTAIHGTSDSPVEITDEMLDLVVFYLQNLAMPARPNARNPQVLRGKAMFHQAGCGKCHTPSFTISYPPSAANYGQAAPSGRMKIWPYSDLLLHDMGPGLADQRREGQASGQEWRTAPLWGIGVMAANNMDITYLHDGRAKSLAEAILWHDGEAKASRHNFLQMTHAERQDLLAFLQSL